MNTILVELDKGTVERLIADKEERILQLDGEMTSLKHEIDRLHKALVDATEGPKVPVAQPAKTPSGRNKRGASLEVLKQYFENNPFGAVSVKQLSDKTGVKYATANRLIHILSEKGKVKAVNGSWEWVL